MMVCSRLLAVFFFFNIQNCYAQFYLVQDPDGYVNVRGEANRVINQAPAGTIVAESMPEFEWSDNENYLYVSFSKGNRFYTGNIYESRLQKIDGFPCIENADSVFSLIPAEAVSDLNMLNQSSVAAYSDSQGKSCYLVAHGGDGGESYGILWYFYDGKYVGRHFCGGPYDQYRDKLSMGKGIPLKDSYRYYVKNHDNK